MATVSDTRRANLLLVLRRYANQARFADALGVEPQYISQLINARPMGNKTARKIEELHGLATGWMDVPHDELKTGNVEASPDIKGMVPLISMVTAGKFAEVPDPYPPGVAEEYRPYLKRGSEHIVAARVKGDSMTAPYGKSYPDGSIIFINLEMRSPTNGQRVVAKLEHEEEATFKVYVEDAGKKWLKPLNPQHPPILDPFRVVGTVVGKWEDE